MPEVKSNLIEGYRLERVVGYGGMGVVLKAKQLSIDRIVAVKILSPKYATSAEYVERFIQEAHVAARLNHANIVHVFDVGNVDDNYFIVMEYVDGVTVGKMIEEMGRIEEREALEIAIRITDALTAAQDENLVHRDIKPENIMMSSKGEVKLCDMGLTKPTRGGAALTQQGMYVGTPYYISPEQATGKSVDSRSDIYSLGMTLYHMLSGKRAFEGEMVKVILDQVDLDKKPPNLRTVEPSLSPETARVVKKAISKKRSQRYQSPEEFGVVLQKALDGLGSDVASKKHLSSRVQKMSIQKRKSAGSKMGKAPSRVNRPIKLASDRLAAQAAGGGKKPGARSPVLYILLGVCVLVIGALVLVMVAGKREQEIQTTARPDPKTRRPMTGTAASDRQEPSQTGRGTQTESGPKPAQTDEEIFRQLRGDVNLLIKTREFTKAMELFENVNTTGRSKAFIESISYLRNDFMRLWKEYTGDEINRIENLVGIGEFKSAGEAADALHRNCELSFKKKVALLKEKITGLSGKKKTTAEEDEPIVAFTPKDYASVIVETAPDFLGGKYITAKQKADSLLDEKGKKFLKAHFDSIGGLHVILKKKCQEYSGKQFPIPLASGVLLEEVFTGLEGGCAVFKKDTKDITYSLALFEPSKLLEMAAGCKRFARGCFCMHNLWFARAREEFMAGKAEGDECCDYYIKLMDGHGMEITEAFLTEQGRLSELLYKARNYVEAFRYQNELEIMLAKSGCNASADAPAELTRRILTSVAKRAKKKAMSSNEKDKIARGYATEMARIAYEMMLEKKNEIARMVLLRALRVDEDNFYAKVLLERLPKK
ncbi:MAG: serine/threonine protein kinase [Planctomycetota bacterium]|jgi:serine/threonine protein kinase